ncbi:MAG TPA: cytosine permease, partial [Candidatus Limnocylindrales bacterium]
WWIRRRHLHLADLYRADGRYKYLAGFNWIAIVSLLVGIVFAIGGSYSGNGKPFPVDGLIPALKGLADYSWVVGLLVSFFLYGVLTMLVGDKEARKED